jgi:hypothetical protein
VLPALRVAVGEPAVLHPAQLDHRAGLADEGPDPMELGQVGGEPIQAGQALPFPPALPPSEANSDAMSLLGRGDG